MLSCIEPMDRPGLTLLLLGPLNTICCIWIDTLHYTTLHYTRPPQPPSAPVGGPLCASISLNSFIFLRISRLTQCDQGTKLCRFIKQFISKPFNISHNLYWKIFFVSQCGSKDDILVDQQYKCCSKQLFSLYDRFLTRHSAYWHSLGRVLTFS